MLIMPRFNYKDFFLKNWQLVILIILALVFFFVYSYLSFTTPVLFNSPDETANFVFIRQWVETGQLPISEPFNQLVGNIIHPRSVNVTRGGELVPGGFLGLILIYGWLAKIFGLGIVKFLTPLFAAAAGLFFHSLIKKIFNNKIAWLSIILFFINPAWWYYASRGLLPNVLLVCLLVTGLYLITIKKYWTYVLAGLFFGLALSVRLVEALWLIPALIILLLAYAQELKKSDWLAVGLLAAAMALALWPNFYYQQKIYGEIFKSGYSNLEAATTATAQFFSFGFHPRLILKNFYDYYVKFFWWLILPALGGFLLLLKRYKNTPKQQKVFLWLGGLTSIFLIIYYGSGLFADNLTPWRITIGDSHLRYWLLVYIFSLPLIAYFFLNLKDSEGDICKCRLPLRVVFWLGLLVIVYFSCSAVLWRDEESILAIKKNIVEYNQRRQEIKKIIPLNSIVIVQRGDKVFFPERRTVGLNDLLAKIEFLPVLNSQAPLYAYLDFSEQDLKDFTAILNQQGFIMGKIKDYEQNEDLYRIIILGS